MLRMFDYFRPPSLEEALLYVDQHEHTKILAGGTDLLVLLRRNQQMVAHVLDIKAIPEMHRLEYIPQTGLFIGAAITVNQIIEADDIQKKYRALAQAAEMLASYQIRNRATVVGNICNASPGADLAAPLLLFDTNVHIANRQGERMIRCCEFFTGVKKTVLQPGDIVTGISLPDVYAGDRSIFLKQARLKGHDLGIVGVAARLTAAKELRLAMTAVAPTPIRLTQLENMLNTAPLTSQRAAWAGEAVQQFIAPISDVRSSAEYRLHVSGVLVNRAIMQLLDKGGDADV